MIEKDQVERIGQLMMRAMVVVVVVVWIAIGHGDQRDGHHHAIDYD